MPKIGIIISTTREARYADKPTAWIHEIASSRNDMTVEIIDLRDYGMPLFSEPASPAYVPAKNAEAQRWNAKIASLDGYIFVTAEYNHGMPAALKNAIDHSYVEFNRKAAAFVGYGGVGGARSIEHLRMVCVELQLAPLRNAVYITMEPFVATMKGEKKLADFEFLNTAAKVMLDDLVWWTNALSAARSNQ